jgi:NitT/TauT family transport system ATP-binding protein
MKALRIGFLPLLDAAILIVAHERGFAKDNGLALNLVRESSWANIRDRMSVGQFEAAHMLAPLPIAQNLGLSPLSTPLIVPFALGLGGNAITVSRHLAEKMARSGDIASGDPRISGLALANVVASLKSTGSPPLTFAVVHEYSGHAYELRYWLAAHKIRPELDVRLTVVPPTMMSDALASGVIDGYCVGEPWNSLAAVRGHGTIVTTKAAIWRSSPEKVLGVRAAWAQENAGTLRQLIVALHRGAQWCAAAENRAELGRLLSKPEYLDLDESLIARGLSGHVLRQDQDDFLMFAERAANFPWVSHALWFYSQMVRWKQVAHDASGANLAAATYRPDLYRQALGPHGVALPGASSKVEGVLAHTVHVPASEGTIALGPDGFFDGTQFDPDLLESYMAQFEK